MNWFANLLVVSGAGVFGYFAEPSLRLELTGKSPTSPSVPPQPGSPEEAVLSKVNLLGYAHEQLPKELTLKKDLQVTDSASGVTMTIPSGSRVKFARLEEGMVVVTPGAPTIEGKAEVQDTDIREQLLANPPPPIDPNAIAANPANGSAPSMGSTMGGAAPDDAPEPAGDPEGATAMKEDGDGSNPALTPESPPEDAAATAEYSEISADEIVQIMQESLKSNQITEFKFEQVSEWTAGEPEEVDGKKFNTGNVVYKGQTFLGVKPIKAKAYINGGKVIRWVMPNSGTEIK